MRRLALGLVVGVLAALCAQAVELTAANAEVVVAKEASDTTQFAAEEMADFLSQSLGAKIPLVNGPSAGKTSVIVGDNVWSRAAGLDPTRHPQDTYLIRATANRVYVLGKDDPTPRALKSSLMTDYHDFERGSVHGVYAFLETYAGVRFYFVGPLGTVVPKRTSVAVPDGTDEHVTPDYLIRQYYAGHEAAWFETPTPTPRGANPEKLNWMRLRMGTKGMPRCHGSRLFRYLDRFRTSHPDYFALKSNGARHNDPAELHPGHLCYSSDVREVMYQDVKAALTGRLAAERDLKEWGKNVLGKMVDIMPEDGLEMCHCAACQATIAREAKGRFWATPLVWRNTADIAQRLIDEGIEGTITQMAYSDYRGLPDFDLPTNIIVQVAENGPWTIPDPKRLAEENAEIRAWVKKVGHKVWLWNYPCKVLSNRLKIEGLPCVSPHYWGEYYKMQSPYIIGAFAESETERYSFNYLNYYVYSRVSWDTQADVQAILDEHHRLMFGAGAADMARLYDELEEIWVLKMAANVVETPLGPLAVVPSDADIWSKVYSPSVLTRLEGYVAAAKAKAGEGTLEAARADLIGREYLGAIRAAAEKFAARQAAVSAYRTKGAETNVFALRPLAKRKSKQLPKEIVSTKVRTWRTQDALRIVFDCEEPHMAARAALPRERDSDAVWSDDNVQFVLFPGGDRRVQYHVAINSEGSIYDVKTERLGSRGGNEDPAWDCRAKVDIAKRADGWTCDVTIPARAFHAFERVMPANFCRTRSLKGGLDGSGNYVWGPETIKGFQDAENFGTVEYDEDSVPSASVGVHRLWYREPAPDTIEGWESSSLPVGCGWFGANVFGGVTNERIQITHNAVLSTWEHRDRPNLTDALEILIRTDHTDASGYSRGLDLETATAWVEYDRGNVKFRREVRASYPSQTMAIHLTASEKGALDFTLAAGAPFLCPFGRKTGEVGRVGRTARYALAGDELDVYQELENYAIRFDSRLRVVTDGVQTPTAVSWTLREGPSERNTGAKSELEGDATQTLRGLRVTGATEATIYFSCGTNYRLSPRCFRGKDSEKLDPIDPSPDVKRRVDAAVAQGYDAFVAEHQKDVAGLMGRVSLDLGGVSADAQTPTDELLKAYAKGRPSALLEETYFQFGRYLLLSSSRPGTLPANLQGLWTAHRYSPWGSGYWHNINVQMNYWPAFSCNLAECFEAYAAFNAAFRPVTHRDAWKYVNRVAPANLPKDESQTADWWSVGTSVWPYRVDGTPGGHSGPGTLGLTTKLFADWWYFTRDEKALREQVWPVLHGAADFLSRCCIETNGLFLAAESASPEQLATKLSTREYMRTHGGKSPPYYQTVGCAFDQQMIYENARDFLAAAEALGTNDAVVARVRREIDRYDPVQIGTSGQIKEYREENAYGEIGEYTHRHISQLVGLMPGTLITSESPDWLKAARVTLTERGDDSTGWALAHRLCAWARAGDGDHAHLLLKNLLSTKTHPNLWDVHPPFQIDGNFGATAGVAEMLLQSHAGHIELLPALPSVWRAHGSFRGLCARGAFEVSCAWTNGVPSSVRVVSRRGDKPDVRFAGRPVAYKLQNQ